MFQSVNHQGNSQISQVLQRLNNVGGIFNAPDVFAMPLIDPPVDYRKTDYGEYLYWKGFHFGDIIGYVGDIRSLDDCLKACVAHKVCVAVNFVQSVNLCVLTKTADIEGDHLWEDKRIESVHVYFTDGPKGIGKFLPKINGAAKSLMPGISPLLKKKLSEPHAFPWMVRVNDLCNGILISGLSSKKSAEHGKDSDLVVVPYSCIYNGKDYVTDNVRLGSFNDEIVEATEVKAKIKSFTIYDNTVNVDLVLILLEKPVAFSDYIRPIALPRNDKVPSIKKCRVVGWMDKKNKVGISNSKKSANLTVQTVKSVLYDNDCKGRYSGHELKRNKKMCVETKSKNCRQQLGGALICHSGSKSGAVVWSLYGYQTTGSQCPKVPFLYTDVASLGAWLRTVTENIDIYRRSDAHKDVIVIHKPLVVSRPKKLVLNDQSAKTILNAGQDYSYPKPFIMKPIKRDIFMKNGLNGLSYRFVGGFHFSDIIGYGLADDTPTCVAACLAVKACYSVNFVSNNSWCVLLASAHKYPMNVMLWKGNGVNSSYAYFTTGVKAEAPEHVPRTDGQGKRMPAGTAARYKASRSRIITGRKAEKYKYSWLVRLPGCGGSLINDDLSNDDRKTASNLILTAAHCVEDETDLMKNLIIAKLASYRDDLIEDVEYNVPITKIIMHKDYDSVRVTNDIALLEIKVPVKFNDYIGPVALPTLNQVPTQPKNCKAIGWGEYRYNKTKEAARSGNIVKEIDVEVLSIDDCFLHYGGQADIFYEKRLLCATSYDKENRFVGTCYGDSGGPMFCPEIINGRKVNVIFGVTSVSGGATCTEHPSGFANISALMGWLSSAAIQIKKERVGSVKRL